MKILYGAFKTFIDVTDICLSRLTKNDVITIPSGDHNRAKYFTDPTIGVLKVIKIENDGILTEYDHFDEIKIYIINNTIKTISDNDIYDKIKDIHSKLKIKHGSLDDEFPEQKMAVRYLTGKEKVLEIGGNIGRNSLVIASILEDSANLVSLESDATIAAQLQENRDLNNFKFHIESSALSKRRLIQKQWETLPSDTLRDGYHWVDTITLDKLNAKYNIEFDTLVLDCEGAFYYILMDMPEILNNINLIIMENDYFEISKKKICGRNISKKQFFCGLYRTWRLGVLC